MSYERKIYELFGRTVSEIQQFERSLLFAYATRQFINEQKIDKQLFIESVKEILQKKGLYSIFEEIDKQWNEIFAEFERISKSYISMQEKIKCPYLKKHAEGFISAYQDFFDSEGNVNNQKIQDLFKYTRKLRNYLIHHFFYSVKPELMSLKRKKEYFKLLQIYHSYFLSISMMFIDKKLFEILGLKYDEFCKLFTDCLDDELKVLYSDIYRH